MNVNNKAGRALDRHGSALFGTVRRGKTKWKQMESRALHRRGSAQTPSAGIGTVPEYRTEQNIPKVRSVLPSEGFYVFFCSYWFLMPIGSEAVIRAGLNRARPIRSSARPV
jgi:hypothetical protein